MNNEHCKHPCKACLGIVLLDNLCEPCFVLTRIRPIVEEEERALASAQILHDSWTKLTEKLTNAKFIANNSNSHWHPKTATIAQRREFFKEVKNVPLEIHQELSSWLEVCVKCLGTHKQCSCEQGSFVQMDKEVRASSIEARRRQKQEHTLYSDRERLREAIVRRPTNGNSSVTPHSEQKSKIKAKVTDNADNLENLE